MARTRIDSFKASLLAFLIGVGLIVGVSQFKASERWQHRLLANVQASVLHLTDEAGIGRCTGFVVARDAFLTAAHCVEAVHAADGEPATLVMVDPLFDIAVYRAKTSRKPLTIAADTPRRGDWVTSTGYAWGQFLVWHHAEVEVLYARIQNDFVDCVMTDREDVGGMSGGPIMDANGDVVSMISRGNNGFACGVTPSVLRAFVERAN